MSAVGRGEHGLELKARALWVAEALFHQPEVRARPIAPPHPHPLILSVASAALGLLVTDLGLALRARYSYVEMIVVGAGA